MIKVRMPNKNEVVCDSCGTLLSYEDTDKTIGLNGYAVIKCPCCNEETPVSETRIFKPKFPDTFVQYGTGKGAVKLNNEEIQKLVDRVTNDLKTCSVGEFKFVGTGDTMVIGLKTEYEDTIIVAQNYYEDTICYDVEE